MAPHEFDVRVNAALRSFETWAERRQETQRERATKASLLLQAGDVPGALKQLAALATDSAAEEVRVLWLELGDDVLRSSTAW